MYSGTKFFPLQISSWKKAAVSHGTSSLKQLTVEGQGPTLAAWQCQSYDRKPRALNTARFFWANISPIFWATTALCLKFFEIYVNSVNASFVSSILHMMTIAETFKLRFYANSVWCSEVINPNDWLKWFLRPILWCMWSNVSSVPISYLMFKNGRKPDNWGFILSGHMWPLIKCILRHYDKKIKLIRK